VTDAEIRRIVIEKLIEIAPEAREIELRPDVAFREQFDFDSLDFLNFAVALGKAFEVELPELDYPRLCSLDGCAHYLEERLAATAGA
jgi:acyl carrier protein